MTHMTGNSDPRVILGIKKATELASRGETELALQHLSALIEEVPTAASVHGYIAIFLSRIGRHKEAVEYGRQAVLLSPTSEKASLVLFDGLCTCGQYLEALDEIKRFSALKPSVQYTKLIEDLNLGDQDAGYATLTPER